MTKGKTNALDALRSLIAERQQYEQWISALESRREATPEHVLERVRSDYQSRLERVVEDIRGHAEELQLSISTLSSRLVEVARDEDTRREGLQEAELRAAVGEYEPGQWEQLRTDAEKELAKIAADRASLDSQLSELRAIQKLSEATGGAPPGGEAPAAPAADVPVIAVISQPVPEPVPVREAAVQPPPEPELPPAKVEQPPPGPSTDQQHLPLAPVADTVAGSSAGTAGPGAAARGRSGRTPSSGVSPVKGRSEAARPESAKTLKCPECGTPNYPTEWYCERCGGELATM